MAASINERAQRSEYGGFHIGAAFFGWLVATGIEALLVTFLAAAGSAVALTVGTTTQDLTRNAPTVGIVSGVLLLLALTAAYYAGGYVAGRLSRFDGGRQGIGVWVLGVGITLLLALVGAIFGSNYNLLQQLNLPHIPVDQGALSNGGAITLIATLLITALAALIGGKAGENYHHKIDFVGRIAAETVEREDSAVRPQQAPARAVPTFGETLSNQNDIHSRNENINRHDPKKRD